MPMGLGLPSACDAPLRSVCQPRRRPKPRNRLSPQDFFLQRVEAPPSTLGGSHGGHCPLLQRRKRETLLRWAKGVAPSMDRPRGRHGPGRAVLLPQSLALRVRGGQAGGGPGAQIPRDAGSVSPVSAHFVPVGAPKGFILGERTGLLVQAETLGKGHQMSTGEVVSGPGAQGCPYLQTLEVRLEDPPTLSPPVPRPQRVGCGSPRGCAGQDRSAVASGPSALGGCSCVPDHVWPPAASPCRGPGASLVGQPVPRRRCSTRACTHSGTCTRTRALLGRCLRGFMWAK